MVTNAAMITVIPTKRRPAESFPPTTAVKISPLSTNNPLIHIAH